MLKLLLTISDTIKGCGFQELWSATDHALASVGCGRHASQKAKRSHLASAGIEEIDHCLFIEKKRRLEASPSIEYTVLSLSLFPVGK